MSEKSQLTKWVAEGLTNEEIGQLLKPPVSESSVRRRLKKYGITKPTVISRDVKPDILVKTDKQIHRLREDKTVTNRKYKLLLRENERLRHERDLALDVMKRPIEVYKLKPVKSDQESEATAFLIASDWHVEETVDPETVLGVNEYNTTIAQQRAERFFVNGMRLVKIFQKDVHVERIVLALLGDMITGYIHEEFMETNELAPADAIRLVESMLVSGIEYMLEDKSIKKIVIPCHSGNHGRMTDKKRHATQEGNSLESIVYHHIKSYFRHEPRVEVLLTKAYYSILDVYDFKIRFHHGDDMRYGGGVGGLAIPVNKAIAQWDKMKPVDLDVFGHFHQFMDGGKWICNGSLIGYNAYALAIKANYEPPRQACFLIDKKRGKTFVCPILLNE